MKHFDLNLSKKQQELKLQLKEIEEQIKEESCVKVVCNHCRGTGKELDRVGDLKCLTCDGKSYLLAVKWLGIHSYDMKYNQVQGKQKNCRYE